MPDAFTLTIPLRPSDLDLVGHVNQAIYHQLLELARWRYLAELTGDDVVECVLARTELDHRREVRYSEGEVVARVWVEAVGTSSVVLGNALDLRDGTVAAEGRVVLVAFDMSSRGKRPWTDAERTALEAAVVPAPAQPR